LNHPPEILKSTTANARIAAADLCGLLIPITTPFTREEEIDSKGLQANLRAWNGSGVSGYVIAGSTGERVNLTEHECQQVIEVARAEVPQNLNFIVGCGQESRRGTISEIKRASDAGADAVLVITPHFYRSAITQAALIEHYRAIADHAPVPVVLYSMPDLTGIRIEPETVAQLCEHPNIIGLKDSSSDVTKFRQTRALARGDFAVLIGNGTVLNEALEAGANGAILAVGCAASELCLAIIHAFEASDTERAISLQAKLSPLAAAVTTRFGIGGLKSAMELKGLVGGPPRLPLRVPDETANQEIKRLMTAAELELRKTSSMVRTAED
jgi:4-hydroxy-2-oxoglutarate aldolase